ncbi:MAG: small multi-drug export protein [Candidatus Limnocylindrales bacterium]
MPLAVVFGLALIEIWAAVPAGIALGVPAIAIWIVTVFGSLVGVSVVLFAGVRIRDRLGRIHGRGAPRTGRLERIWLRYGVVGWGLISPLVMAPPMGTAVALILGAPRSRLLASMAAGVVLWTTILVAAGSAGVAFLHIGTGGR